MMKFTRKYITFYLIFYFIFLLQSKTLAQNFPPIANPDHCSGAGYYAVHFDSLRRNLIDSEKTYLSFLIEDARNHPGPILIFSRADRDELRASPGIDRARAETIRSYLLQAGIDEFRIFARGMGQAPAVDSGRVTSPHNRKTEISIPSRTSSCSHGIFKEYLGWFLNNCTVVSARPGGEDSSPNRSNCELMSTQIRRMFP